MEKEASLQQLHQEEMLKVSEFQSSDAALAPPPYNPSYHASVLSPQQQQQLQQLPPVPAHSRVIADSGFFSSLDDNSAPREVWEDYYIKFLVCVCVCALFFYPFVHSRMILAHKQVKCCFFRGLGVPPIRSYGDSQRVEWALVLHKLTTTRVTNLHGPSDHNNKPLEAQTRLLLLLCHQRRINPLLCPHQHALSVSLAFLFLTLSIYIYICIFSNLHMRVVVDADDNRHTIVTKHKARLLTPEADEANPQQTALLVTNDGFFLLAFFIFAVSSLSLSRVCVCVCAVSDTWDMPGSVNSEPPKIPKLPTGDVVSKLTGNRKKRAKFFFVFFFCFIPFSPTLSHMMPTQETVCSGLGW